MEKSALQNAALVLEGGGFRGIYTTGVLDYLMEQGRYLPNVYGVSAGALNALGYAAKQPGRNAQINFRFCSDKRYVSVRNLLHYRSAFNLEFIFDVIPEKYRKGVTALTSASARPARCLPRPARRLCCSRRSRCI